VVVFAKPEQLSFKWLIAAALLARLVLLFSMPTLSDDLYRFVWDGRLLAHGINPFQYLPYQALAMQVPGIDLGLYSQLNSPHYYSIYPPVSQGMFVLAAGLQPQSLLGNVVLLRVFVLLFEAGSIYLLYRLSIQNNWPLKRVLLYALNPLVIVELTGNLHFEAGMIFFTLLAVWWWSNNRMIPAGLALAMAFGIKLLPVLFLPFLMKGKTYRQMAELALSFTLLAVGMFIPFWFDGFLTNFFASVDLYFRHFEFNASIYYLARYMGTAIMGYNPIAQIGPMLSVLSATCMAIIFYRYRPTKLENLFRAIGLLLAVYLFFATTVHPWYVVPVLGLALPGQWRFPLVWALLVPLTYIAYMHPVYHENLALVGVEYTLVFFTLAMGEVLRWQKGLQVTG
jgi:hypothetical protein